MENFKVNISELYNLPGNAVLECFIHSESKEMSKYVQALPCMIAVPGGGYHFVSDREGEPIAIDFFNRNYNAFVLTYDVAPDYRYPVQITELACAVDYIRKNSEKLRIDPDKIYLSGFSAGGHLVATLANFWHALPCDFIDASKLEAKPNGVMLGYPVIYPHGHIGSFVNLLGENADEKLTKLLTLDETASEKNPPCFIWTTAGDTLVSPDSTLRYAKAMLDNGVKLECHVFPTGWHGGATCDERTNNGDFSPLERAGVWLDLADMFFKSL